MPVAGALSRDPDEMNWAEISTAGSAGSGRGLLLPLVVKLCFAQPRSTIMG